MSGSRLGKGISSIFGADVSQMLDDIQNGKNETISRESMDLPVSQIRPNPYQPRKLFDPQALEELADSIREHGVFTPVLVKKSIQGYELIAGERRLRASRLAGQETIPAIIVDFDDQQMMEISLLENIQRENLNVIEEARAYDQLIRTLHYTQEQLAVRVGKSREHVTNLLRLLKLPEDVMQLVIDKKLSMGHARALLALKEQNVMSQIAAKAIEEGWSVRATEASVRQILDAQKRRIQIEAGKAGIREETEAEDTAQKLLPSGQPGKQDSDESSPLPSADAFSNPKNPDDGIRENLFLEDARHQLEEYFQTSVKIKPNSIVIHYENTPDLTRILELLSLTDEA